MQMNRLEHDLWEQAEVELYWPCRFAICPGQANCTLLAEWIVEKKEEIRHEC